MTDGAPRSSLEREYWVRVADGELAVPVCRDCEETFFPPRARCPSCLGGNLELTATGGTGRVYSYTVVHLDYHPDWGGEAPYVNALVSLDDGPVVFANVVNCDPADVDVGTPVEVTFADPVGTGTLPLFTLR